MRPRRLIRVDDADIERWITEKLDADRVVRTGKGWRSRVLGGRTAGDCMTDVPSRQIVRVGVRTPEYVLVVRAMKQVGMRPGPFFRMCVGTWMLNNTQVGRDKLPTLTADVPHER